MYKQQDCATTGQLVQLTTQTSDKICSPNTIMFWSKEQYKTFKDFKDKKVALTSGFGTGKTVLIRAKAKELSAAGEKVVIVIFEITAEKIILRMEYEKIFSTENLLVTITGISGAKGNQIYCFNVES
jgi:superfamily I DNA and RNA helicase